MRDVPKKNWKWKMWKRSCRARHPSKSESGRCENEAFVRDVLQFLKLKLCKTTPEAAATLRDRSDHDPTLTERVPHLSRWRASPSRTRFVVQNTAFRASANFHAVNCRASQGVSRRSYRLFLFFIGLSLPRNFRHPACPGSTCTDNHLYI